MSSERVVILGASDNPDRYSYKAMKMLEEHSHNVTLISPKIGDVEGRTVLPSLLEVTGSIDTLTMYVNPSLGESMEEEILGLRPKRVIFNPGTESDKLEISLKENGIPFEHACTLVLLTTGQF